MSVCLLLITVLNSLFPEKKDARRLYSGNVLGGVALLTQNFIQLRKQSAYQCAISVGIQWLHGIYMTTTLISG